MPGMATSAQEKLPQVGQTRCYWSLLSPSLDFVYLDPVLQHHLQEQAPLLIGKSILQFVHPEEVQSAQNDLGSILSDRELNGSVTRVRFSRLSRVRRTLGYQGPPAMFPAAEKVVVDENYMVVDIVINWAADGISGANNHYKFPLPPGDTVGSGLVLCFLHAEADVNAPKDNDPRIKSGWSNWCGTARYDADDIKRTHAQLLSASPAVKGAPEDQPSPNRVIQILSMAPGRKLLLTWPPSANRTFPDTFNPPTTSDDSSLAEVLASLVHLVDVSGDTDAKTNCMRRYKARQTVYLPADTYDRSSLNEKRTSKRNKGHEKAEDGWMEVEVDSIFVPHGSIIFGCYLVNNRPSIEPSVGNANRSRGGASAESRTSKDVNNSSPVTILPPGQQPSPGGAAYPQHPNDSTAPSAHSRYHMSAAIAHTPVATISSPSPSSASPSSPTYQGGSYSAYDHPSSSNFTPHVPSAGSGPVSLPSLAESMAPGLNAQHPRAGDGGSSNGEGTASPGGSGGSGNGGPHHYASWGPPSAQLPYPNRYGEFPHPPPPPGWVANGSQGPSGPLPPLNSRGGPPGYWEYAPHAGPDGYYGRDGPQGPPHLPPGSSSADMPPPAHIHGHHTHPLHEHEHEHERPGEMEVDVVPPPRRRLSDYHASQNDGGASPGSTGSGGGSASGRSRNQASRPVGILKCSSCKATSSPEWRKGPSGKKELCNACGLRYARSRAKKEGTAGGQRGGSSKNRDGSPHSNGNGRRKKQSAAARRDASPFTTGSNGMYSPGGSSTATGSYSGQYSGSGGPPSSYSGSQYAGSNYSPVGSTYSAGSAGYSPSAYPPEGGHYSGTPPPPSNPSTGSKRGFSTFESGYDYDRRYEEGEYKRQNGSVSPSPPSYQSAHPPYPSNSVAPTGVGRFYPPAGPAGAVKNGSRYTTLPSPLSTSYPSVPEGREPSPRQQPGESFERGGVRDGERPTRIKEEKDGGRDMLPALGRRQ